MNRTVLACFSMMVAFGAAAEIEKVAAPDEGSISFRWWPKVNPPPGWQQDRDASFAHAVSALVPVGRSFADAPTVMYAKAVYKPRIAEVTSLDAMIERDKQAFVKDSPGVVIHPAAALKTADGRTAVSFTFTPGSPAAAKAGVNWERVSYLEEGEFYLVFTVSSRTQSGFRASAKSYETLVSRYRE
jgi:hypothetical protein